MNPASKIDEWWAANPAKHQQVAAAILILWLGGLGIGLIAVGVDDATSIKRDLAFVTRPGDPSSVFTYHLKISAADHQRAVNANHALDYVTDFARFCDPTGLYSIAKEIKDSCGAFATNEQILQALLTFVQDKPIKNSLHYIDDPTGYAKYPMETLADGGGDCEDVAILFASLAETLGYDTLLVLTTYHAFAAVYLLVPPVSRTSDYYPLNYQGAMYYPCECTGYGWLVGDLTVPYSDIEGAVEVCIVDPVGITTVAWVLPISAGAVVVVVIVVAKKKQRDKLHNVVTP